MSETKHTPGPWATYQDHPEASEIIYIREAGSVFLTKEVCVIYTHNLADGKLIAAAPDMLAELEECRRELLGASSYLATCDLVTIAQNLDSFTASLKRRLASVEALIAKTKP